jgi:hypothetical protein
MTAKNKNSFIVLLSGWNRLAVILLLMIFSFSDLKAQVFWTETFSNSCSANCVTYTGPNGAWTFADVSAAGTKPNKWFVSCAESGNASGSCGSGCSSANDPSLHVGCAPTFLICSSGDCGAAYNASGAANVSNKRAMSPLIDCTGKTGISLSFAYIGKGQSCTTDYCDLQLSTDGGSTWSILQACLTSSTCGSGQGLWKTFTITLPAAADNNANVKIGFRWQNNGDGAGSDPSFAVDDITLSVLAPTPIELLEFKAERNADNTAELIWKTATETNNDYFTIERSADAVNFSEVKNVKGMGNSAQLVSYSETDLHPLKGLSYYRLKQTDFDGKFSYSATVPFDLDQSGFEIVNVYNNEGMLEITSNCDRNCEISFEMYDVMGKKVFFLRRNSEGKNSKSSIPVGTLSPGIYFLKAFNGNQVISRKIKL